MIIQEDSTIDGEIRSEPHHYKPSDDGPATRPAIRLERLRDNRLPDCRPRGDSGTLQLPWLLKRLRICASRVSPPPQRSWRSPDQRSGPTPAVPRSKRGDGPSWK